MPVSGTRRQSRPKPGRECHHCKQWIAAGEAHDCWTTTESALTRDLPEDLRDAWKRLRGTASGFGEQRIYASGTAIMFSRKACYFFVRPKVKYLEVFIFLGRRLKDGQVHSIRQASKTKLAHIGASRTGMRSNRPSPRGAGSLRRVGYAVEGRRRSKTRRPGQTERH